jgi:hypothetical protein
MNRSSFRVSPPVDRRRVVSHDIGSRLRLGAGVVGIWAQGLAGATPGGSRKRVEIDNRFMLLGRMTQLDFPEAGHMFDLVRAAR